MSGSPFLRGLVEIHRIRKEVSREAREKNTGLLKKQPLIEKRDYIFETDMRIRTKKARGDSGWGKNTQGRGLIPESYRKVDIQSWFTPSPLAAYPDAAGKEGGLRGRSDEAGGGRMN